jgi:hypothetical protein
MTLNKHLNVVTENNNLKGTVLHNLLNVKNKRWPYSLFYMIISLPGAALRGGARFMMGIIFKQNIN